MSTPSQSPAHARLILARDGVRAAKLELERTVRDLFPCGSDVSWLHGEHMQSGIVVRHGYGDDLIVSNHRTGKETKISSCQVEQAMNEIMARKIMEGACA